MERTSNCSLFIVHCTLIRGVGLARRIGIVFFLFVLGMGALCVRIMRVPLLVGDRAGANRGGARVVIDSSRGAILDRNGAPLVRARRQAYAAVKPTPGGDAFLRGALSGERYARLEPRLARGNLLAVPVDDITAELARGEDNLILYAYPRYDNHQLAPHLIGHLDQAGAGAFGLEKAFDGLLAGAAGELAVRMPVDAKGRALPGGSLEEAAENYRGAQGVQLTIDARAQRIAQEALAGGGIARGAAVVLDAATSEILALASAPAFDPGNIAPSLDDPLLPFFNRALGAYPVGSTFKCFIAAAALEQGISPNVTYECTGELEISGHIFRCKEKIHGAVDMSGALAQSCNLYFIRLTQRMRPQPALDLARLFGFGGSIELAPGIASAAGNLPSPRELALPGERANFSFGQGKLLGTPLQMAAATACIANGGVYNSPILVKATLDAAGTATPYEQPRETRQVISPETAATVRQMMVTTVEEGSGSRAKPRGLPNSLGAHQLCGAGGKTATAQSGKFGPDGSEILHTAFTGFFPAENPRYVITVFRENGSSGALDCAPVFREIAEGLAAPAP